MYLFKGKVKDLLPDIRTNMKLKVKSDTMEYEIIINGIECTYCGTKDTPEMMHSYEDVDVCEGCYEHFNDRWD